MDINKYNLLKAAFYSSASTRNVIIDERLEELGFIIELLEKTEQIFKSMSFDIKNIIEYTDK